MSFAQRAIDSTFRRLGIAAVLDPDGAARPVLLLPGAADATEQYGSVTVIGRTGVYQIRAADFAGYGDRAVLDIDGERREVQAHRVADDRRLKVVLDTVVAP